MKISTPYYKQQNIYMCGPASLQMVFDYFQNWQSQKKLARQMKTSPEEGTNHGRMIQAAIKHGFYCYINKNSSLNEIRHFLEKSLPVIVNFVEPHYNEGHYAVVTGMNWRNIILHDPWNGKNFRLSKREFLERWHDSKNVNKEWIMVLAKEDFKLGRQYMPKQKKK